MEPLIWQLLYDALSKALMIKCFFHGAPFLTQCFTTRNDTIIMKFLWIRRQWLRMYLFWSTGTFAFFIGLSVAPWK